MWVPVAEVLKEGAEGRKAMSQEHGWHFQGIAGKTMWLEWAGRERENTRRQSGGGGPGCECPLWLRAHPLVLSVSASWSRALPRQPGHPEEVNPEQAARLTPIGSLHPCTPSPVLKSRIRKIGEKALTRIWSQKSLDSRPAPLLSNCMSLDELLKLSKPPCPHL